MAHGVSKRWDTGRRVSRETAFMRCPECGKKGVTLRLGGEDWFTCRYCQWTAASGGYDDVDIAGRAALRRLNPGHRGAPLPEPWEADPED